MLSITRQLFISYATFIILLFNEGVFSVVCVVRLRQRK